MRCCALAEPWWRDAVVYQVYPRSFQDSDGDGIGDLRGIIQRLDDLAGLGVDALWLSPMYPSPFADGGYDIADHTGVEPRLGSVADVVALAAAAHARGLRLLLDLVPNHTSIEHPWFREHPDRYVWADGPANNWRAAFGGPAWSRDGRTGRFYLHSFYPEQPDLDWRNPAVPAAMQEVIRTWLGRGVDGFRIDAIDRIGKHPDLLDDPPARTPPPFPETPDSAALEHRHSRNWAPALHPALAALRAAAGDAFLIGEVYQPTADLGPYLDDLSSAFVFELLFAEWRADVVGAAVARAARLAHPAWMLSNHDFSRVGTRIGERNQPRGGDAPADPARHGLPLPGRRDRPARRARRRPARRPFRPRPPPPPDAVGRRPARRVHDRDAVACARRSGRAQRRRPARRPGVAVVAPPRPDRAAAGSSRRPRAGRRATRADCSPTAAATSWSR